MVGTKPDSLWQKQLELESWLVGCSDLVVSPERAAWIQSIYPETDVGRPGILAIDSKTKKQPVRNLDADEDTIENAEIELAVAAD
jgi:hypothetical protein